ncbi:hypothetical protein HZC09_06330 [Candidatus Micrarchaeota archaeon]|nr:hypothetical protein [Candidatus Micrarchaeota archaeon]
MSLKNVFAGRFARAGMVLSAWMSGRLNEFEACFLGAVRACGHGFVCKDVGGAAAS